jgi:hypothetical protein
MDRVTFIVPWEKSMSPHFKPNNPLWRKPVDPARRTRVRSRMLRLSTNALIISGHQDSWCSASLRSLTDEMDWIAVKQLIAAGMIEENGYQVSNLGATALRQRQVSKPRLNLYCSDLSQFILSPVRTNPSVQICLIRFLGCVTAPGIVFCEFTLLEMIAELCDRNRASTNPRLLRIDLCQQDSDSGTGSSFVWIARNGANYFLPLDTSSQ